MTREEQPPLLIADDDPDIRTLLGRVVERAGYSVISAADRDEGLDLALEHHPCLAIIDVMLAGQSGLDLVREFRDLAATRGMPIILVSALVKDADVRRGLQAGADRYLAKPFSPRVLVRCIDELLGAVRKEATWTT